MDATAGKTQRRDGPLNLPNKSPGNGRRDQRQFDNLSG